MKHPLSSQFTVRATQIIEAAKELAIEYGLKDVFPACVLIALIQEGTGVPAKMLIQLLGSNYHRLRPELESAITRLASGSLEEKPMSLLIDSAIQHAQTHGVDWIGSEHLMLAILSAEDGIVPQILSGLGVSPIAFNDSLLDVLGVSNWEAPTKRFSPVERQLVNALRTLCSVCKSEQRQAAIVRRNFRRIVERALRQFRSDRGL